MNILKNLDYNEGLRTALCMSPMIVAYLLGHPELGIPMGQAGFFFSAQPLSKLKIYRVTTGVLFMVFGLGLYLIGGNVVYNYWPALIYTFIVSLALSFMNGWRLASLLAFSFFSVYSAGLNSGSPEKVKQSFFAFAFAIAFCTLISIPKFWKGIDLPKFKKPSLLFRTETGLRMGFATSVSFAIADLFAFSKLGWAPSAAANVIRFEEKVSFNRAKLRAVGTIVGALGASLLFIIFPNPNYWVVIALIISVANGLTHQINKWGFLPFYTTVILILYSLNDPITSASLVFQRIGYNIFGVVVALLFVNYSFPIFFRWLERQPAFEKNIVNTDQIN